MKRVSSAISEETIQKQFEFKIQDVEENCYVLTGEVLKTAQIPYKKGNNLSILNENLSHFRCEDKEGFGITEYLVKIE
ncbi:MAG: hypothetical protein HXS48_03960 [Theionarchaea archaeon]|nr:MAG: hypothetical protein AYK19_03590 [Theionarchaea archaeon DG-70-1]MBU7026075.1 hypothetical protein [Theionarchaea archaeon]